MSAEVHQFRDFELDPSAGELRRNGQVIHLERIPLELLSLLVERSGEVVTREEILERVWGKGVFIDTESSINTAVRKIRRALGDDADAPRYVVTVAAKGYRFVAPLVVRNGELIANGALAQPLSLPDALADANPTISHMHWRVAGFSSASLVVFAALLLVTWHSAARRTKQVPSLSYAYAPTHQLPDNPSVAVLPFANLSNDAQEEYFSDGIADQLINDLSRVSGLFVIARNSSFVYKGKPVREPEIGRELGVKYVLEGSVRKAADRIRISVELVDTSSGTEMWTQQYERPLKDIFAVQDEIVSKVVTTLSLLFKLDEMRVLQLGAWRATNNLEAFDDFLRAAQYFWRSTKDDNTKARLWLEKAIALDPTFSAAYSFLGWTYYLDAWSQWSEHPQADLERSSQLAHQALALDDSNSDAFALLSSVDWNQRRFDQAVVDGQRAVTLNPNYAGGYSALSDALETVGKSEEALRAAQQAIRLDPSRPDLYAVELQNAYGHLGREQEAIFVAKSGLAAHPDTLVLHLGLVLNYIELGRDQDARAEAAEVMRISPRFALPPPGKGWHKNVAMNQRWDREFRKAGLK